MSKPFSFPDALLYRGSDDEPDTSEFVGPPCEWCEQDSASCDCHTFECLDCWERFPRAQPPRNLESYCAECADERSKAHEPEGTTGPDL